MEPVSVVLVLNFAWIVLVAVQYVPVCIERIADADVQHVGFERTM